MSVIAEAEELALSLSESDRAKLASKLLRSLRPVNVDEVDGFALAFERDRGMDADPTRSMTVDELNEKLSIRFPYLRNEDRT